MVLSVLVFSYLYRTGFYIWYLFNDGGGEPNTFGKDNTWGYVLIGSCLYIFGEGLHIIIIFSMHYYKFVYEPEKLKK